MPRPAQFAACCLLAITGSASADPGFLAAPTDQLGVPGLVAGAEITPEGHVYTGSAEYAFRFGPALRPWNQPTRERAAGRYPVFSSTGRSAGVRYRLTILIDAVAGEPVVFVRVDATNENGRAAEARWNTAALYSGGRRQRDGSFTYRYRRPVVPTVPGLYVQPGEPFAPEAQHAVGGGAATRDGRVLYVYAGEPAVAIAGPERAEGPATRFGRTDFRVRIPAGATRTVADLRMPAVPRVMTPSEIASLRAESFATRRAGLIAGWRAGLAGATALEMPEAAVRDAWRASVVQLLEPRYTLADGQWVQPVNKLQYHSFWIRDTAIIAQALDLAGLPVPAAQDLSFFARWQQQDGLFISRAGQLDGLGQALWGLGEHVRLTGDAAFATAQLPAIERAVGWLKDARGRDALGLVPPSDPGDNELVAGHLVGDNFWAVAGLDAAADLAAIAGREDLATGWREEREDLRSAVVGHIREAGGPIPPALDADGGKDWGNLWAAWPYPVLAPRDPQVTATLRSVRRRFAEGIATYGESLHGYIGFRVFQTELARGEQRRAVDGLYASLAHLTATDGCFELGTRPYGRRLIAGNLAPHGWCSAEIVTLLRNMLVRERGAGLQLLGAVSPAWLGGGRRVGLRGAPTRHGKVDVRLTSTRTSATLTWAGPAGVPLWWTIPVTARDVTIDGKPVAGRLVRLPSAGGTLRVRWRLEADGRSLSRTKARLARAYERRGLTPPF